jgi:subtilase family serine protease
MKTLLTIFLITLCAIGGSAYSDLEVPKPQWREVKAIGNSLHSFVVALEPNYEGVECLQNLILSEFSNPSSPKYGRYLPIDQINQMVGAPIEVRERVISELGALEITCNDFYDSLRCYGTIGQIDRVFGTDIRTFEHESTGRLIRTSIVPYQIPDSIQSDVVFVDGLSNRLPHTSDLKRNVKAHPTVDPGSVSREVLERMYSLYPTFVGSEWNVSVGAMEFEDTGNPDGFDNHTMLVSQTANGVPINPITPAHLVGQNGKIPDGESDLDVQVMYWAASDAELWYETSDHWMYSWAVDFFNRRDVPEVVSLSWGWSETQQCTIAPCNGTTSQIYVNMSNIQFMKIVARGITIVVASGDAGSPGRTNEACQSSKTPYGYNHINPVFPGGSPWVLSVGATYVVASDAKFDYKTPICASTKDVTCANGLTEQSTTFEMTQWTSGAGFDHWDSTPSWQAVEVKSYLNSGVEFPDSKYFNQYGRAYPDISAFGHNCITRSSFFGWENADGTSCASPIIAGGIANLNGFAKSIRNDPSFTLGFVNPLLYRMGREMPEAFNDVVVGNSSCTEGMCCGSQFGFVATKGWDVVSGWGTPNFEQMKIYLDKIIGN